MPVYGLKKDKLWFPDADEHIDDIISVGGDLKIERLVAAYNNGVFPWYNKPGEFVWWQPVVRCVLFFEKLRISHSMRNVLNQNIYTCTVDTAFREVMEGCRGGKRQSETWIHDEVVEAYCELHKLGLAHSFEVWKDGELAGGLYGVSFGRMFCGESMFALQPNASKAALIFAVHHLHRNDFYWIDCQVANDHLLSLGAEVITRDYFLTMLRVAQQKDTLKGNWSKLESFSHQFTPEELKSKIPKYDKWKYLRS